MSELVRLKKANRVLTVDAKLADGYLKRGYDQINEEGKIVKHATGGKTVTIAEHNAVLVELAEVKAKADPDYVAQLEAELEEIKAKAEKFAEKGKQLQEENHKLKEQLKGK